MTDRPILFSAPMVRAILAGQKTQTRRTGRFYGRPGDHLWVRETWKASISHSCAMDACDCDDVLVSYAAGGYSRSSDNHDPDAEIRPGDVDERWVSGYEIAAHEDRPGGKEWLMPKAALAGKNVSPLFMPRWASRITLEVTGLRAERLQDITEADAKAEGVEPLSHIGAEQAIAGDQQSRTHGSHPHTLAFAVLWDTINGDRAPWVSNPWVWVVGFERVLP